MLFQNLAIAAALTALTAAQEIEQNDIPQQCTQLCSQVVTIARDCDNRFNNDDNGENNCICTAPNASTLLPACEACVRQYDTDDDADDRNDNDVRDVLNRCNFTAQSSFDAVSASSVVAAASTASAATTGSVVVTVTSGTNVATSVIAAPTQANTQNAAPAVTAAAGLGLGAAVLAMGMF